MTETKIDKKIHPTEAQLAGYLDHALNGSELRMVEDHIAGCRQCLESALSAYESVKSFRKNNPDKKEKGDFMKKINIYLILSLISFVLMRLPPRR